MKRTAKQNFASFNSVFFHKIIISDATEQPDKWEKLPIVELQAGPGSLHFSSPLSFYTNRKAD